jgi:hypothetical protein
VSHLHEGDQGVDLGGQNLVQGVAVVAQRHTRVGRALVDVDLLRGGTQSMYDKGSINVS